MARKIKKTKPRTDTCDRCDQYYINKKATTSPELLEELDANHAGHIEQVRSTKAELDRDVAKSHDDPERKKFVVLFQDQQKVVVHYLTYFSIPFFHL